MLSKKKAFTLMELLVVVLIIGVLAAVAVPRYQVAVLKSQLAALVPVLRQIKDAEEVYYIANGEYTRIHKCGSDYPIAGKAVNQCDVLGVDLPKDFKWTGGFYAPDQGKSPFKIKILPGSCNVFPNNVLIGYASGKEGNPNSNTGYEMTKQFEYVMWLNDSEHPGLIECVSYTDFGTRMCKALGLYNPSN